MRHLRDFLHPVWRDAFKDDKYSDKTELNQSVLDVFDEKLQEVEDDTIHSKAQSFLSTATDEWLDYWGSWFGLKRENEQQDDFYRQALLNHVKHGRNTIPALRKAIADFLKTNMVNVNVYEPYTDVFILDDSNLDSEKRLRSSDYYTFGVIDIQIGVPFPPEVIDIINWFRPAGVLWTITYRSGLNINAPDWNLPPYDSHLVAKLLTFKYKTGFDKEQSYLLTPNTRYLGGVLGKPFITDDSLLDGIALLSGSSNIYADYYNAVGSLNGLIQPATDDTVDSISKGLNLVAPKDNYMIEKKDSLSYPFTVSKNVNNFTNMLKGTYDFDSWYTKLNATFDTESRLSGAKVVILKSDQASITKEQKLNLRYGEEYTLSLQAKTVYSAPSKDIGLYANIDKQHTSIQVTDKLNSDWNTYSVTFTYRGSLQDSLSIYSVGDFEIAEGVAISNIQLEKGDKASTWHKSFLDMNAPLEDKYTYVYTLFNVRDFFYDQIKSEGSFRSSIGFDNSNTALNKAMVDYLEQRHIVADYKIDNTVQGNVHTQMMLFNFKLGMWVNFRDDNIFDHDTSLIFTINAMDTYLNDKGLMVIAFRTNTLDEDFIWRLNEVQLATTKTYDNENSINIFGNYISDETALSLLTLFNTDKNGNSLDDSNTDLYDRYQKHYPIRYIRNTIKKVHLFGEDDNIKKGFITDKSLLSGTDYLVSENDPLVLPADKQKNVYTPYQVIPNYFKDNKNIPLVSVSILGASVNDDKNKNILGNLLTGGVDSPIMEHEYKTSSELMHVEMVDDTALQITDKAPSDDVFSLYSQATYKEQPYRYTMNVKSNILTTLRVRIMLVTNEYKYPQIDTTVTIGKDYQPLTFKFDTNKVFADTIEVQLLPMTKESYDLTVKDPWLGLDTKVYVDDKESTELVPQIIPLKYPIRGTGDKGTVTYKDLVFDDFKGIVPTTTTTTSTTTNKGTTTTTTTTRKLLQKFLLDIAKLNDPSFGLTGKNNDGTTTSIAPTTTTTTSTTTGTTTTTTTTTAFPYMDAVKTFASGIIEKPLKYSDEQIKQLTYALLDNADMDTLPDFRTVFSKTEISQDEVDTLLRFLDSYKYHLVSSGSHTVYDFSNYLDNGTTWLESLGFQAQGLEHTVMVDLGRVHTDISDLLVHHGSDSNLRVEYDSIVQTSTDGEHWKTWYNNYKNEDRDKDNYYLEPQARPQYIPIGSYNLLQQRKDFGQAISRYEFINGTKEPIKYVSAVPTRLPVLSISKLVLDSSMQKLNGGLMLSTSGSEDTLQRFMPIRNRNLLSPSDLMNLATPVVNNNVLAEAKVDPVSPNETWWTSDSPSVESTTTSTGINPIDTVGIEAKKETKEFVLDDSIMNRDTTTTTSTTSTTTTTTTTLKSRDIGIPDKDITEFTLNKSLLDSLDQLVTSAKIDKTTTTTTTTTIKPETPMKEMNLVQIDIVRLVSQSMPYLWNSLHIISMDDKLSLIKDYLLQNSDELFSLVTSAASSHGYYVALWNYTTAEWDKKNATSSTAITKLTTNLSNINDYISNIGKISIILASDTLASSMLMTGTQEIGYLTIMPSNLDQYKGGLYPHVNRTYDSYKPVSVMCLGYKDKLNLYSLKDEVFGHKVVVSFNLHSIGNLGTFDLKSYGFDITEKYNDISIESGNQHYSFIVNMPMPYAQDPRFYLDIHGSFSTVTVSGFKVEYGLEESPYIFDTKQYIK